MFANAFEKQCYINADKNQNINQIKKNIKDKNKNTIPVKTNQTQNRYKTNQLLNP
jgi:hypothetical protein